MLSKSSVPTNQLHCNIPLMYLWIPHILVPPGISHVHLVSSAYACCSSFRIPFTDCLTALYFSRFTHAGYLSSTRFTGVNIPFAAGMPIFACRHFPMTKWNVLKFTHPLWLISFRVCKIFHFCSVLFLCIFMLRQKSTLEIPLLFPIVPWLFRVLLLILGMGCRIWWMKVVGILCVFIVGVHVIGEEDVTRLFLADFNEIIHKVLQ